MKAIMRVLRFWADFVFGDDWTVAAAVAAALVVTALLAPLAGAWVVLPLVVLVFVAVSLWRASRR